MKRPWMQLYTRDWLDSTELRRCSPLARSVLTDLMCIAHEGVPYGHLTDKIGPLTDEFMSSRCVVPLPTFRKAILELQQAERLHKDDSGVMFIKRMVLDEDVRVRRAAGGKESIGHPNTHPPKTKEGYPSFGNDSRGRAPADSESVSEGFIKSENQEAKTELVLANEIDMVLFEELLGLFVALGRGLTIGDKMRCQNEWFALQSAERKLAHKFAMQNLADWQSRETSKIAQPWNYLRERHWERAAPRILERTRPPTKAQEAHERAARAFREGT